MASRPKVCPRPRPQPLNSASKRLFPISGPLEPSLYLYRFLEMGQYITDQNDYCYSLNHHNPVTV